MPLDYAPRSSLPWHARQRPRRVVTLLLFVAALLVARRLAPFARDRANEYLVLRRCLHFTAPPNQVAFDADPARATAMPREGYRNELNHETPPAPVASFSPPEWVALLRRVDPLLQSYRYSPPLVFMGERRTATGVRRLLLLRYAGTANAEAGPATHAFEYDLIDPSGRLGLSSLATRSINLLVKSHPFTRLYFGQPDPGDAARFSFRYETEAGAGMVEGRLDDQGALRLEVLDGPEATP